MTTFSSPTLLALSSLVSKFARFARPAVPAGSYAIDETITLHLSGTLKISPDTEATPTSSIPWKRTLALFLRNSGATRDKSLDALVQAMQQALTAGEDAAETLDPDDMLEDAVALLEEKLAGLPKTPKRGCVDAKGVKLERLS